MNNPMPPIEEHLGERPFWMPRSHHEEMADVFKDRDKRVISAAIKVARKACRRLKMKPHEENLIADTIRLLIKDY